MCVSLSKLPVSGLPWASSSSDSALPLQGVQIWSMVGELRSHMPRGMATTNKQTDDNNSNNRNCLSLSYKNTRDCILLSTLHLSCPQDKLPSSRSLSQSPLLPHKVAFPGSRGLTCLSFWDDIFRPSAPSWWEWSCILLWFWFEFSWWLMVLIIFSWVY